MQQALVQPLGSGRLHASPASTSRRSLDVVTRGSRRSIDLQHGPRRSLDACAPRVQARSSTVCKAAVGTDNVASPFGNILLKDGTPDYYTILGVDDDAPQEEIKRAYRAMAKECHPDFLGDEGHNICILLNQAYAVLSDPDERLRYNVRLEQALKDFEDDYTGKPLSKWCPTSNPEMAKNEDPAESRAVFVDEFSCIGCKNCIYYAAATFRIEPEYGRSRVFAQWINNEKQIQTAIDSCPVNCIHWVQKDDLPMLEYITQKKFTERVNVGVMMANQNMVVDVWDLTASYAKQRKRKEEELLRRQKAAWYSPAQEQARRSAAQALRKKTMGTFFGSMPNFEEMLQGMFASAAGTGIPNQGEDFQQVGKRKRAVGWRDLERMNDRMGTVPRERALISMSSVSSLSSVDDSDHEFVRAVKANEA